MNQKEIIDEIGEGLELALDGFKYMKPKKSLHKTLEKGWNRITLDLRPTSDREKVKLLVNVEVQHSGLEEIYALHNPYLKAKDRKWHPTIGHNCDEIFETNPIIHGFNYTSEGIADCINTYAAMLKKDALPWLEKYSSEEFLFDALVNDAPFLSPLVRYPVLMAIYSKRENLEEVKRVGEEFLNYCKQPHAQVYTSLAESTLNGILENLTA